MAAGSPGASRATRSGSDTDISAARTIQAGIADDFTRYGVRD